MENSGFIGKEHNAHLDWLLNTWMNSGSPVCFLEGFPGTGKTTIARELLAKVVTAGIPAVMIAAPETDEDPTDDLLLDLASELNSAGKKELAQAIENNRPLLDVLSTLVNEPILIIIDDFQRSMQATRNITSGGFAKVLSSLANRRWLKGRILLLSNRIVERARWSEPYAIRTLNGMSTDDAVQLLEFFAQERRRIDEISPERRRDVVQLLGGNPRAIRLFVRNLAYESLDELIGIQPELWETKDRKVSSTLVEDLERHILEKTLKQIPDNSLTQLCRLSVLRKSYKRQAMELLYSDKTEYAKFKEEMIDRFLMEQHKGWFSLHPIVREIGLQKISQSANNLQQAHSILASYYTRHFQAKQIVGWGALGGYFVEARYHLVKAGRPSDLKDIATHFQGYVFSTLSNMSPIPKKTEELEERIAVLSALLETPGPGGLEYHLARLFQTRNQRNDLQRALHHARRARPDLNVNSCQLCAELLAQMERYEDAIDLLREGIEKIPVDKGVVSLYNYCANLLAQLGQQDDAVDLLKQGINRIAINKDLAALYDRCGNMLAQTGRQNDAIALLKQGIDRIPPEYDLAKLYHSCGQLLSVSEQQEAITLLKQGINRIPPDKDVAKLYDLCGKLLAQSGQQREAVSLLRQGINRIPPEKQLVSLYDLLSDLLIDLGQNKEAIILLQEGIAQIPPNRQLVSFYNKCSKLLIQSEQFSEAIKVLKQGIKKIHAGKEMVPLYITCSKLLLQLGRNYEATTLLKQGVEHLPGEKTLNELLLQISEQHDMNALENGIKHFSQVEESSKKEDKLGSVGAKESINVLEDYVDFDLHIATDGHIVASSPEGQATDHISTQLPSNIRLSLQLIELRQTDANLLKEIGSSLYDWLFPNTIHTHLQQTEAVARSNKAKLRLRLRVESAPIASLPLEFIYRETGGYFMAVNPDTVLSRYLNLPVPPERVRRRESPLHMLTIIADPTDQVRLNPDEWESIVKEAVSGPLTNGELILSTVKRATRKEIRDALLTQKPDIIQFVGHGIYENGKGHLALVDEDTNKTWLVDDERFANLFLGSDDHLGLVVMATCESAQSDNPQSFLGIAPQLIQRGIPAVVAMQYSVYIRTAKVFLDDFYTAVATRKPIDWAVQSARNGISLQFGLDNREFATPVLYMRAKDGNVF